MNAYNQIKLLLFIYLNVSISQPKHNFVQDPNHFPLVIKSTRIPLLSTLLFLYSLLFQLILGVDRLPPHWLGTGSSLYPFLHGGGRMIV